MPVPQMIPVILPQNVSSLGNRITGESPHLLSQTLASNKGFVLSTSLQRQLSCQALQTWFCQSSWGSLARFPGSITTDAVLQGRLVLLPKEWNHQNTSNSLYIQVQCHREYGVALMLITLTAISSLAQIHPYYLCGRSYSSGNSLPWLDCLCKGTTTLALHSETH